jgi:hypothetical protein
MMLWGCHSFNKHHAYRQQSGEGTHSQEALQLAKSSTQVVRMSPFLITDSECFSLLKLQSCNLSGAEHHHP